MVELSYGLHLILSAVLFTIGACGVIIRRNGIIVFMCIELMLNAANLAFISTTGIHKALEGMIFVFFVMTVAAAEAAVGLAIFVMIFRLKGTISVDQMNLLKG